MYVTAASLELCGVWAFGTCLLSARCDGSQPALGGVVNGLSGSSAKRK